MRSIIALALFFSVSFAFFSFEDEVELFGLELEKLLNLASGLLSLALLALTAMAYRRSGNRRLLFVSLAFLLFAVKGALTGSELFFPEFPLVDPIASALDFAILLSFFAGILGK
ncbi:MAG: hypothetical protein AB1324_03155 [Candidatus Micrarchaeota archaeon]